MTLRERITADAAAVFLNVEEFAEEGTFFPGGDRNYPTSEAIVAVVEREISDQLGDRLGFSQQAEHGQEKRRQAIVEVAASLEVNDQADPAGYFQFEVAGAKELWTVKRILGSDEALQTILCIRNDVATERRPRRRA